MILIFVLLAKEYWLDRGEINKIAKIPGAHIEEDDNKNQYNIEAARTVTNCICYCTKALSIYYDVKFTNDFCNILEKAKESTSVPVIISVGVDYSRNRILLDDNFIG